MMRFLVLLLVSLPAAAPVSAQTAAEPERPREERLADAQEFCREQLTLKQCVESIVWVNREIDARVREAKRLNDPELVGNLGMSLMGCSVYCHLRYFPSENPAECKASVSSFRRLAKRTPYLWQTILREDLAEQCGRFSR